MRKNESLNLSQLQIQHKNNLLNHFQMLYNKINIENNKIQHTVLSETTGSIYQQI